MKKQSTLTTFLQVQKERKIPEEFCLKWKDDMFHVIMNREENMKLVTLSNIKCNNCSFEICLYTDDDSEEFNVESNFSKESVPFLKSALQKSIRRGLVDSALSSAYALLSIDHMTLYRRLPIIMVEDVHIHNSFPVLVWLMMANYKPSAKIVAWIMGLVYYLCNCTHVNNYDNSIQIYDIPDLYDNSLIWSIFYRIKFGGMNGDLGMLAFILRNLKQDIIDPLDDKIVLNYGYQSTNACIHLLEAVDFHILPSILFFDDIGSEEVKKMMWCNSSSINFRKTCVTYKEREWADISVKIKKKQQNYIKSIIR